tara:strand:- start:260 stop:688 length:429 start_codon:yes stop_codon:yes gene_type:complete
MKFNFCIWLTCDKTNDIYKYNGGFYPHMTIKMNLSLKKSVEEYLKIGKCKIFIELVGDPVKSYEDGFAAVYYKIDFSKKNKFEKPIWWPKNAHVSFLYKYYKMITDSDIENLKNKIKKKSFYLDKYKIMICNDHHTLWKCIL